MAAPLRRLARPRTIACIGRNYADHIAELGNTRPREPFHFLKPSSSILHPSSGAVLSPRGANLHYEVELAAVIGREVDEAPATDDAVKDAVKGWAVAIDMTARQCCTPPPPNFFPRDAALIGLVQNDAKKKGLPWTLCKGFKTFLPVSHFIPAEKIKDPHDVRLFLRVNGETRQDDSTGLMLFRIPRLLQHITSVAPLEEDDLLLTGTPKGVGEVRAGDVIEAGIVVDGVELEEGRIEVVVEERASGYNSDAVEA